MPRLEDVLAELAAVPGVHAAALGGFDGLLVDEAMAPAVLTDVVGAPLDDPAGGEASEVQAAVPELRGQLVGFDLDGAIVELTHAWNAVKRACSEHLEAGAAREVIVVAEGGVVLAHAVGGRWFALVWAAPHVELAAVRVALRRAAERLGEVVA
jgi:predicted regulator of Ras-like GTPase activity (Roadblock/LC7/MglB family)